MTFSTVYIYNKTTNRTWECSPAEAYYCYKSHQLWPIQGDYAVLDKEGNQLDGLLLVQMMYKARSARKQKLEEPKKETK